MTDAQLLERFVIGRDDEAFRDLVQRHGPRVRRVCRRVLRDENDAEDAFQATFIVLVRRAPSIAGPDALGNWLHGVAYRVACRTRRAAARRRDHETRRGAMGAAQSEDRPWDDQAAVVRDELSRLPDEYRAPLELFYVRGLGHEEAATALGWPLGTLKTRLVRGRRRLQERLDRRGLTASLALLLLLSRRADAATICPTPIDPAVAEAPPEVPPIPDASRPRPSRRPAPVARTLSLRPSLAAVWLLVAALAVSIATAGGVHFYGRAAAAEADRFADLPAALMDVLRVQCR